MQRTTSLRFADLKARKIVSNRTTLRRWIQADEFPAPVKLGENSIAWRVDEVKEWDRSRPRVTYESHGDTPEEADLNRIAEEALEALLEN